MALITRNSAGTWKNTWGGGYQHRVTVRHVQGVVHIVIMDVQDAVEDVPRLVQGAVWEYGIAEDAMIHAHLIALEE